MKKSFLFISFLILIASANAQKIPTENIDTAQARKNELMKLYDIGFPVTTTLKTKLVFLKPTLKNNARSARGTDGYKPALDKYRSTIISYHDSCVATIVNWKSFILNEAKYLTDSDKEEYAKKMAALEAECVAERKELDEKFPAIK